MKWITFAIGSIAMSQAAIAKPVYLACTFSSESGPFLVNVTPDEEARTVALYMPSTGNREQLVGTFTADQVLFSNAMMQYRLSRVDLSIERVVPLIKSRQVGECKLDTPPKRAF